MLKYLKNVFTTHFTLISNTNLCFLIWLNYLLLLMEFIQTVILTQV